MRVYQWRDWNRTMETNLIIIKFCTGPHFSGKGAIFGEGKTPAVRRRKKKSENKERKFGTYVC